MTVCRSRDNPVFFSARSAVRQACSKLGLTIILTASALLGAGVPDASAKGHVAGSAAVQTVAVNDLPVQAADTLVRIGQGGPFPHAKDGTVFGNRERLLPGQPRGHYREYTVKTVGARNRGARRIVCGGRDVKAPDACFYTDDHYASFRRIVK